jgi:alpha-1,2-mannosyltransferase
MPHDVARVVFLALELASVLGALRLVGVADRRVLLWATLSYPVVDALLLGNPTLLLMAPIAAAWRWRERWVVAGLTVGLAGALKLLIWPLGVWLLATRRVRAAALAAVAAAAGVLLPWALLGFRGFDDYARVADLYEEFNGGPRAISIANLIHALGGGWTLGHAVQFGCGAALLAAAVARGLRRRHGDGPAAFVLGIAAALVLSPVVWIHYLALALVGLAALRPTFGRAWYAVTGLWIFPLLPHGPPHTVRAGGDVLEAAGPVPTIAQLVVGLGFVAYISVLGLRGGPSGDRDPERDVVSG